MPWFFNVYLTCVLIWFILCWNHFIFKFLRSKTSVKWVLWILLFKLVPLQDSWDPAQSIMTFQSKVLLDSSTFGLSWNINAGSSLVDILIFFVYSTVIVTEIMRQFQYLYPIIQSLLPSTAGFWLRYHWVWTRVSKYHLAWTLNWICIARSDHRNHFYKR